RRVLPRGRRGCKRARLGRVSRSVALDGAPAGGALRARQLRRRLRRTDLSRVLAHATIRHVRRHPRPPLRLDRRAPGPVVPGGRPTRRTDRGSCGRWVFTHLPSNALLAAVAVAPTEGVAIALLLARFALSQMDVPARQAYVVDAVEPGER